MTLPPLPIEFGPSEKSKKRDKKIAYLLIFFGIIGIALSCLLSGGEGDVGMFVFMFAICFVAIGFSFLWDVNSRKYALKISKDGVSLLGNRDRRNDWKVNWDKVDRVECEFGVSTKVIKRINIILKKPSSVWMAYRYFEVLWYSIDGGFDNLEYIFRAINEYQKRIRLEKEEQELREKEAYLRRLTKLTEVQKLDPVSFEKFVGELFVRMGYTISYTKGSGDEGVDIFIQKDGKQGIVQCKRYTGVVGQYVLRDFFGSMIHNKAKEAYLITTGSFSLPTKRWAQGKPIHLVDGTRLVEWAESVLETTKTKY